MGLVVLHQLGGRDEVLARDAHACSPIPPHGLEQGHLHLGDFVFGHSTDSRRDSEGAALGRRVGIPAAEEDRIWHVRVLRRRVDDRGPW
jgi:hypothetical protein